MAKRSARYTRELAAVIDAAGTLATERGEEAGARHLAVAMLLPIEFDGYAGDTAAATLLTCLDFEPSVLARRALEELGRPGKPLPELVIDLSMVRLLDAAWARRSDEKKAEVNTLDVLGVIVARAEQGQPDNWLGDQLLSAKIGGREIAAASAEFANLLAGVPEGSMPASGDKAWARDVEPYVDDMTAAAAAGRYDPVIGRDAVIERVVRVLSRRTKSSLALLGEPGVGKTAIAEGVAARLAAGTVPPALRGFRMLALSPARLVAGTSNRGDFEERVLELVGTLTEKDAPPVILFIDEMHTLAGAGTGSASEPMDLANILKPALARGDIHCLGATTSAEWRNHLERDGALARRFETIEIAEPTAAETLLILRGVAGRYAAHHQLRYSAAALSACVELAERHLPNRRFPDKAIDLLDEAGAAAAAAGQRTVGRTQIENLLRERLGHRDPAIANTDGVFHARLFGDARDVAAVIGARIEQARRFPDRHGPLASAMLFGPPSCGRGALAATLADEYFAGRLVEIDLAAFDSAQSISSLIGSPPGYVGYAEPARLVEPFRRPGGSVLLLRNLSAAAPAVGGLVSEILMRGELADAAGRTASYRDTLVLLAEERSANRSLGFGPAQQDRAVGPAQQDRAVGPEPQDRAVGSTKQDRFVGSSDTHIPPALRSFANHGSVHVLGPLEVVDLTSFAGRTMVELGRRAGMEVILDDELRSVLAARLPAGSGARTAERVARSMLASLTTTSMRPVRGKVRYRNGRLRRQVANRVKVAAR